MNIISLVLVNEKMARPLCCSHSKVKETNLEIVVYGMFAPISGWKMNMQNAQNIL